MATLAERFNALIERDGTHHRWLGATDQHDIPQMRVDGRLTTARRVAWQLHHGPLPHGARIHPCPNDPRCVRVEHLTITEPHPAARRPTRMRRRRGQGSIREIRPGVWKLTITTESQHRVSRTITADHTTALRELARFVAQHGQPPTTLDALVTVYFAHLANAGRSQTTLRRYRQLWQTWLSPSLAATPPDNLRPPDIEAVLRDMHDAGQSHRSIHQAAIILNTALAWAHDRHMTRANPVVGCQLPNGTTITTTRHR